MDIIYQRNIDRKLFMLRLIFLVLLAGCILCFTGQQEGLGYLLVILLLTLNFIVITGLTVTAGSFGITKYYAFTLIKQTWRFNKGENLRLYSRDPDFGQGAEKITVAEEPEELGCLFAVFSVFVPSTITKRQYEMVQRDEYNDSIKKVRILLSCTEFNYLSTFIPE